jgi:alpha,alpha-trehalase
MKKVISFVKERAQSKKIALFLDYDGTLTPIVQKPELAFLHSEMKNELLRLSKKYPIGIISGRDVKNVENLVGIDGIYYAGSHGFDIIGPSCSFSKIEKGDYWFSLLERLQKRVKELSFEHVELKPCSLAIHYRLVEDEKLVSFHKKIEQLREELPDFKVIEGKKVFEFQPNIDWNKGKALLWLLDFLELNEETFYPIYIGDDLTDEDAFLAIKNKGLAIAVLEEERETHATYTVKSVKDVKKVLEAL